MRCRGYAETDPEDPRRLEELHNRKEARKPTDDDENEFHGSDRTPKITGARQGGVTCPRSIHLSRIPEGPAEVGVTGFEPAAFRRGGRFTGGALISRSRSSRPLPGLNARSRRIVPGTDLLNRSLEKEKSG